MASLNYTMAQIEDGFVGASSLVSLNDSTAHYTMAQIEDGFVGASSLVSACLFSVILWHSFTSEPDGEEDRWSFSRSMKVCSSLALIFNIYQLMFIIVLKADTLTIFVDQGVSIQICWALGQFFYSLMAYSLVLSLLKTIVWPNLRLDYYLYPSLLVPASLDFIIRLIIILIDASNSLSNTLTAVRFVTASFRLFILSIIPLVTSIIATSLIHKRQPEHFMRMSCRRMGAALILHFVLILVYGALVNLVACNNWKWKGEDWDCSDYSIQIDAILVTSNVLSQVVLPVIPALYLHAVHSILR